MGFSFCFIIISIALVVIGNGNEVIGGNVNSGGKSGGAPLS